MKLIDKVIDELVRAFGRWADRIVIPAGTRKNLFKDVRKIKESPVCGDEIMLMRGN